MAFSPAPPVRGMLFDIEGTTSSVSFVYEVLFPYARQHLAAFLKEYWNHPDTQAACELVAKDAGYTSLDAWTLDDSDTAQHEAVTAVLLDQMDRDVKATGLKAIHGLVWEAGHASGELRAHVYEEVADCLRAWKDAGIDLRIYSSGSIKAQHLFFGHSAAGNLLPLFSGHYDTTTGPKREQASYAAIATAFGIPAGELLFFSDVVEELDAARSAGWQTVLVVRPGNAPVADGHGHPVIADFTEIRVVS
ncbi:MAG: acireductone synthase [Candidatus Hydrogenedens sp.]|nr:acireductone synthase [Candidatus Hydrogenedens sp.]